MSRGLLGVYWRSMRRSLAVLACCASISAGCSSAGGSSGSGAGEADAAHDASAMKESGSDDASDLDATGMDAAIDSGLADSTVSSTDGAVDAATDSTSVDSSAGDTSVADSASVDSSVSDSAVADSSSTEAAVPDAGDAGRSIVYASGVVVSTLAGNGIYGDIDGTDASFANPTGIALYGSGGVIVVENDTGAIRVVLADGTTKTIGTSPVDQAQTSPFTIVTAPQGYYYSTDFDQSGVHVDGGGAIWSFLPDDAGSGASSLTAGGFYLPRTLVPLPGGDIFVFDTATAGFAPLTVNIAERLTPSTGTLGLIAGQRGQTGFANGDGGGALFGGFTVGGVLLPDASGVVVADCNNSQLRLITLGGTVTTFAGSTTPGWADGPAASALFSCPHALAIDSAGNIYVSDGTNNAIRRVGADGNVTTLAGDGTRGYADGPGNVAEFYGAEGMVVSADGTTLFVADGTSGNGSLPYNRIRKISLPALDGG